MDLFDEWRSGGTEIQWRSTTPDNNGQNVRLFTRLSGTPGAPALVLVHGFPTYGIDFHGLTVELGADFEIFTVDFPGFGLSEKPPAPYRYSLYGLYGDARLLVHLINAEWGLRDCRMLTHDRGSSVGMIAAAMLADTHPANLPVDLFITNANIYLPLSNLTAFQRALLDEATGPLAAVATTPQMLAAGLGAGVFMPRRAPGDPKIAARDHQVHARTCRQRDELARRTGHASGRHHDHLGTTRHDRAA